MRACLLVASTLMTFALACRAERSLVPAPSPPPAERGQLLERILALAEVAPCLAEAGPAGVRLVDVQLAGEVAGATFDCANGAAHGRVTFFRIAGRWSVATKSIETSRDR